MGGTVHLTISMNDQGTVEAENIDYRPDCYSAPNCSGTVHFEKADRADGQELITTIWGQEVLEDFQASTLIETDTTTGTKRWYQGNLYNYETWHYDNYTIVHFGVVSKQTAQTERIERYRYCLRNYC